MLISKEEHYTLKDLFQVKLLSCAIALFCEVCFILSLNCQIPLLIYLIPLTRTGQPSRLYPETSQTHLQGMTLYRVMFPRGDTLLLTSPALHPVLPGRPWVTPLVVRPHSGLSVVAVATWPRANHPLDASIHLHPSTGVQVWVNETTSVQ